MTSLETESKVGDYGWIGNRSGSHGWPVLMRWMSLVLAVTFLAVLGAHPTRAHTGHVHSTQTNGVMNGSTASSTPLGHVRHVLCRAEFECLCRTCGTFCISCGACCSVGVAAILSATGALWHEPIENRFSKVTGPAMSDNQTGPEPPPPKRQIRRSRRLGTHVCKDHGTTIRAAP